MAIGPLAPVQLPPHVPIGDKLAKLQQADQARRIQQQNIQLNDVQLREAARKALETQGYNAAVAGGGTDEDITNRVRNVGAGAYTDWTEHRAKLSVEEANRTKSQLESMKAFTEQMSKMNDALLGAKSEDRPLIYKHLVLNMKSSGDAIGQHLPEQYDENYMKQFVDVDKKLGEEIKNLDIQSKKAAADRLVIENKQKDEKFALDQRKLTGDIEGTIPTEEMKNFNDKFYKEFLPSRNLTPSQLNPQSEAALRTEFRSMLDSKKTNKQSENVLPYAGAKQPVLANYNPVEGTYTDTKGNPLPDAQPYFKPEKDNDAVDPGMVQTVIDHPELFDRLTPTEIVKISPALAKAGFNAFGKQMSESAIAKVADSKSAMGALKDLRQVLNDNEKYIGPVEGFASLNPWSEAKKAKADIDRVKQRVGKTLEGGVLRKEDEEKYKGILATLFDTPSTAIYKVDQMLEDLQRDMEIFVEEQRAAGRKVNSVPKPPASPANPATGKWKVIR